MRRWIAVAVVGGLVVVGCTRVETVRQSTPDSTSSTGTTGARTVSGTVTFEETWTFDPGDFPRTVHNGESCRLTDGGLGEDGAREPQLVVQADTGAMIGEAGLGVGEITGLGSAGFDLPTQLETVLIASESLVRRAACSFTFSMDVAAVSPSYSFAVDGHPGVAYSHDDLEALAWVVDLAQG